ncbi:Ulp1 family isopeptidase [Bradyrhizobium sp. Ec3.3]|uniref:Ulp1 family isopeptidase n=1 Tax=Bradyrhizobium sp. Ec3.3 TaxID=189753 RepID=UPI0003F602CD|nr:Ulp1 family isopeptidase [Bradyrhizobium sp. Ec3.3]
MSPSRSVSAEPSVAFGDPERPSPPGLRGASSHLELPFQSHPAVDIQATVPVEDFTHIVGLGWDHGCQSAPDALIGSLHRKGVLPATPLRPQTHFYIHGRPYTTKLGQGTKEATLNNPRGLGVTLIPGHGLRSHEPVGASIEGFPKNAEKTSSSTGAERSATRTSDGKCFGRWWCLKLGLGKAFEGSRRKKSSVRLGQPDRQASGSRIPPQRRLKLRDREWLGDQHITADYMLLEQEWQTDNPDLAARTRFVRPAMAHLLRWTECEIELLTALQAVVEDEHENDTADFLFLPVSNASAADPARRGTHWSLLLIDRRAPEGMIAYHYDSFGGSNSSIAEHLSGRLGARLQPARIAQQQNNYDCGVFVLEATRVLVGRLAQRQRPDDELLLHLDNLVVRRKALQDRLSARAP